MRIIASIGDINGIGLEAFLKAAARIGDNSGGISLDVAGNSLSIKEYIDKCKLNGWVELKQGSILAGDFKIGIVECSHQSKVDFGAETADAGKLAIESIEKAFLFTKSGDYQAMVTLPISKHSAHLAGFGFPGHTEMLAALGNCENPLMILFSGSFRVALVTIHIPLHDVPVKITPELIIQKAIGFHTSLKMDFGKKNPRIAVLGLNPHAGEDGDIGTEEIGIIKPAINSLKLQGIHVEGPFPADGFFARKGQKDYDGVLAMYHDQGLIPLKFAAKGGVNFTAGLPVVRTSPDHGTAFAIAGKGMASELGTLNAILFAKRIYNARRRFHASKI